MVDNLIANMILLVMKIFFFGISWKVRVESQLPAKGLDNGGPQDLQDDLP